MKPVSKLSPCKRHYESRIANAVVAAGESTRRTPSASVTEEGQIHADVPQAGLDRQVRVIVSISKHFTFFFVYFCNVVPPPCFPTRSSDPPANDDQSPILRAGDRVGVCLSSLDAKLLERGVLTTPGSLKALTAAVALVQKVSVYNSDSKNDSSLVRQIG